MTGKSILPAPWALLPVLLVLLLVAVSGASLAIPGDLTATMELDEARLEAGPQEEPDTVVFHGNVTFEQPIYQYAQATITADLDKNWTVTVSPSSVSNRGPGTRSFTVSVEVPISTRGGEVSSLEVVAEYSTRFGDTRVLTESATVTVKPWVGYRLNLTGPAELVLGQGRSGVLMVPVRNVGNEPEYFSASVPYWYGLRPLGVTVTGPSTVLIQPKKEAFLEFKVTLESDVIPRVYVFDLLIDAQSLGTGGEGATENPRPFTAKLWATGDPPPDDPYEGWAMGDPPDSIPNWESVFGSQELRANPDINPEGDQMVYDQVVGTDRVIYLGDASGSGAKRLTNGHDDHHPVFSPNGQMIAFARMPDRIIIVNLNGTELMEFGSDLGEVNITDWSPSGDRLLLDSGGNIYELDLRTNVTWLLASEPVDQRGAVYSPDGGRIYYISYEAAGERPEVWTMFSDGSVHTQLTFNDQKERTPSVSPNGKLVAFALEEETLTGDRVCVMNADGSDVRYFTDRSRSVFQVRWLPDGDALVAEVSLSNSSHHDIQSVSYPWEDAGFKNDGGGGGGPGDEEGIWGAILGLFGLTVIIGVLIAVVASLAFVAYRKKQVRAREESAERLREITGQGPEPQGPIEVVRVVPEEERFRW